MQINIDFLVWILNTFKVNLYQALEIYSIMDSIYYA